MNDQSAYWNKVAKEKNFTHPLDIDLLNRYLKKDAVIIDYGCGYGRLTEMLIQQGFTNIQGFDFSEELIRRGHANGIMPLSKIISPSDLPHIQGSVDGILLFAVLTCIPENHAQKALIESLTSLLKKRGVLYLSDYYLQPDSNEMKSYFKLNQDPDNEGVFVIPEGVTFRHHTTTWIKHLLADFSIDQEIMIDVRTMNGHRAKAFQILAVKK